MSNMVTPKSKKPSNIPTMTTMLKLFFAIALIYGCIILFTTYAFPFLQDYFDFSIEYEPLVFNNPSSNESEIWLDYCNLTDIDPWDSTIMEFIKPEKDHMLNCIPKIFQSSKLIHGQLYIYSNETDDEINCRMRCLMPLGDWYLKYGKWIKVINGTTKPECDVIEVECYRKGSALPYYIFYHAQIYRKSPPLSISTLPPKQKFDVHVIVLDAVSQTQFIRSMSKTVHILREMYEAIPFRHLNKIGINSHPNGFAILIGKTFEHIPKSPFSKGHKGQYPTRKRACRKPLDNEQFIGFRYKDDGYVTMMAEDWRGGALSYPYCEGFQQTPMDHYMKPFQIRSEQQGNGSPYSFNAIYNDTCHEPHHYICDYLKDFLKAYPEKPKFSISWMISLTHDEQNALSSSDDYFYQFFKDTQKDFENSFLFIMGDHGLRFGKMRETEIGEIEDNNPMLFLSIPKKLRDNSTLMHQLRINSKELITHYDVYATLVDLVHPPKPRIAEPLLLGNSLLQPLPQPRTCDSLRIPFEYCHCRAKKTLLPKNNTIGETAANLMIERINLDLSSSSETSSICAKLTLNETAEIIVEDYGGEQIQRIYKITFTTVPGDAKFWGVISYDPKTVKIEIISTKFLRLNAYGDQAECAKKSDLASYCYCI